MCGSFVNTSKLDYFFLISSAEVSVILLVEVKKTALGNRHHNYTQQLSELQTGFSIFSSNFLWMEKK